MIPCRFCGAPAVGVYALDKGCFCYPDDREQALCSQHVCRATPVTTMILVRAFVPEILGQPVPSELFKPEDP